MAAFFDDFDGAAGQWIRERTGWAHLSGYYDALQTDGSGSMGIAARAGDGRSVVHDVGATSMYAEVVIGAGFLAGEGECLVNVAADASTDGLNFAYYQASGELRLRVVSSALYTYSGPLVAGDTLKLCYLYSGYVYELYLNGVLLTSGDIAAYTPPPVTGVAISLSYSSSAARSDVLRSFKADVYSGPPDTTPPTLTSATATAGNTTATGTVTTNENNGTLYYVATINATETAVTVKAGLSQAVTATGVQNVSLSGLTNGTTYRIHYVHTDAALNDSTVLSSNTFTPHIPDSTPPTMNGSITVGTKTANSISISYPAASDDVGVAGYEVSKNAGSTWQDNGTSLSYTFLGLSPITSYDLQVRAYDAAGNRAVSPLTSTTSTYRAGATAADVLANTGPQGGNPAGFMYAFASTVSSTDWLSYTISSGPTPSGGTLVNDPDGSFTYVGPSPASMIVQPEVNGVASPETITVTLYDQTDVTPPVLTGSITLVSKTYNSISVSCPTATDDVGVVAYEWSSNGGSSWTDDDQTHVFSGLDPETAYQIRVRARDAAANVSSPALSLSVTTDAAPDVQAPTLTSPTAVATGATTATGTVSTDEANGTLYWLTNTSASATAIQVKAGLSQAVVATGVQNVSSSGLTASTAYYIHYLHRDAAGNDSTVVRSPQFTTQAPPDVTAPILSSATASATSDTTSSGSVSTDEANGTLYWLTNTSATATATQVKAGLSQAVTATGVQNTTNTGLTASTTYYTHFLHRDAAGNDSAIVRSSAFATQAAPDTENPTLVGSITVDSKTHVQINVSCPTATDNVGVVAYEWSKDSGSSWVDDDQTHSFTGLVPETTYQIRVRARDAASNRSNPPLALVVTTNAAPDVVAPILSSPTASATSYNSASGSVSTDEANGTLYWLTNSNATATANQVKTGSSQSVTSTGNQSVTASGLTPSTNYYMHFLHRDAAGNDSAVVDSPMFTTPASPDTEPPVLTGSITVVSKTHNQINASCPAATDNVGVIAYEWSKDSGTTWADDGQTHSFTGLDPETAYGLRVRARDAAGNRSTPPLALAVTTDAAPDVQAPTLTLPTAVATGTSTSSGTVTTDEASGTLYWLTNTSATSTAATVKNGSSKPVTATGVQTTTNSGLLPSTDYYTHFLHRDGAGNDSAVVRSAKFTTDADTTPPTLVGSIVLDSKSYHSISVTSPLATDDIGVVGYDWSSNGGSTWITAARSYTFAGLNAETVYQIRARARDAAGNVSTPPLALSVTTDAQPMTPSSQSTESRPFLGDAAPRFGVSSGSGRTSMRTPFGRITVAGKAGEVRYVSSADLASVNMQGIQFLAQSIGGDVAIALTLAPVDLAFNPGQTDIWVNSTAVSPGGIVELPFIASAVKITFTEDAVVYLMIV